MGCEIFLFEMKRIKFKRIRVSLCIRIRMRSPRSPVCIVMAWLWTQVRETLFMREACGRRTDWHRGLRHR